MYNITRVLLVAGHAPNGNPLRQGGFDIGASFEGYREELQTIVITNRVAKNISPYIEVLVAPDNLNYQEARIWADQNYKDGDFLFEPHRDSTGGNIFDRKELSTRFGVYYVQGSFESKQWGQSLSNIIKSKTGNPNTWLRLGDFELIRDCKAPALLVECGFMQGDNSDEHINWLADILSDSILEFLGIKKINEQQIIDTMIINQLIERLEKSQTIEGVTETAILGALKANKPDYLFDELEYKIKDIKNRESEILTLNTQILDQKVAIQQKEAITLELSEKLAKLEAVVTQLQEQAKTTDFIPDLLKRFTSRKFLVTLSTALGAIALQKFPEYKESLVPLIALVSTYLLSQGAVDVSKEIYQTIKTI